jgi:nucleoside-diphosphate-sugar epimerase
MIEKVGITGAAGHIGSTIVEGLKDKYAFTLFDIREIPTESRHGFRSVMVDLSRAMDTGGIFEGLDAVIHLAANPSPNAPWESVLLNNIVATYNVYEEARRSGIGRIVFASSNHVQHGHVMGENPLTEDPLRISKYCPIKLSDPPAPDSLYGVRNSSAKTSAGITPGFSASASLPCASAGRLRNRYRPT